MGYHQAERRLGSSRSRIAFISYLGTYLEEISTQIQAGCHALDSTS